MAVFSWGIPLVRESNLLLDISWTLGYFFCTLNKIENLNARSESQFDGMRCGVLLRGFAPSNATCKKINASPRQFCWLTLSRPVLHRRLAVRRLPCSIESCVTRRDERIPLTEVRNTYGLNVNVRICNVAQQKLWHTGRDQMWPDQLHCFLRLCRFQEWIV